jgi:hypothetical protein
MACTGSGGTYKGNGTVCDPNPCLTPPPTGACCAGDGSCSITTSAGCTGTYQGDGTVCDPNPCPIVTPCCTSAFFHAGQYWLTKTINVTGTSFCDDPTICNGSENAEWVYRFDPVTCNESLVCSGSGMLDDGGMIIDYSFAYDPMSGHCRWNGVTEDAVLPLRCFGFSDAGCSLPVDAPCTRTIYPFPTEPECFVTWTATVEYSDLCTT